MKKRTVHYFVISAFTILYAITSLISTVHVVDFFKLTNPEWLAISLAIAFEIGAAASLASIIALEKMNKFIVWMLFIILTLMQAMGNTYYAYVHAENFQSWIELFGLVDEDLIYQKRILGLLSGGILPIVALGYIKALIDYIKPTESSENPAASSYDEPKQEEVVVEEIFGTPTTAEQTTQLTTTVLPEIPKPKPAVEFTTEPPTTTESPRLNNTEPAQHDDMSIDDRIARGKNVEYASNLKKPHDP